MPEVTISDSTFKKLQRHARPLVDTIDSVINRALDSLENNGGAGGQDSENDLVGERRIDPLSPVKLTHTKLLEASIAGRAISKPKWNPILHEMIRTVLRNVSSFERLRHVILVNMVKGKKEDEGYKYLPDIDVSVQGQDADAACRAIITAAQRLGLAVEIVLMWRNKEGAAHPGEKGRLTMSGKTSTGQEYPV